MKDLDRGQGNCKLVSCSYHEDGYCTRTVDTDDMSTCVLTDGEYAAEISRDEWIEYYETRDHPGHRLTGRTI